MALTHHALRWTSELMIWSDFHVQQTNGCIVKDNTNKLKQQSFAMSGEREREREREREGEREREREQ